MEKHEKIQKTQLARFRWLVGAVTVGVVCGLLWMATKPPSTVPSSSLSAADTPAGGSTSTIRKAAAVHLEPEVPPKPPTDMRTEAELEEAVKALDEECREVKDKVKRRGAFMETDPEGLDASQRLQEATRLLMAKRYGPFEPYRVRLDLTFQDTMPDFEEKGAKGQLLFEMGPARVIPHSVFSFLEIARNWKKGAFHRNAGHVLQVMVQKNPVKHLAFQEYSIQFPHKRGTIGYAGRPSGPAWYISIEDNTRNHGPGSQQAQNPYEADAAIGTVIEGFEDVAVNRIHKMPGHEFINDPKKHVLIDKMTILVPTAKGSDTYVEWKPSS